MDGQPYCSPYSNPAIYLGTAASVVIYYYYYCYCWTRVTGGKTLRGRRLTDPAQRTRTIMGPGGRWFTVHLVLANRVSSPGLPPPCTWNSWGLFHV